MKTIKSVSLFYRAGSSDKQYNASIVEVSEGTYRVEFAFGRRGETLKAGTKTQTPVTMAEAEKIYTKLLAEKQAKGYSPGEDGTPYVGGAEETRVTGIAPQLLNAVDEETAADLLGDPAYATQEKMDGRRLIVRARPGQETIGINRKGLTCGLPEPISDTLCGLATRLDRELLIDGEAVGDTFFAFDLLQEGKQDHRSTQYRWRYAGLELLGPQPPVIIAPIATDMSGKAAMFANLKAAGKEGIVFKRLAAPYTPGRPASGGDQFKFKFVSTVTCVVAGINAKRSISISVLETLPFGSTDKGKPLGTSRVAVDVGNCTIPPNKEIPKVGDLVEIRYLYFHRGGSLYQPFYIGQRDDLDFPDSIGDLKLKAEGTAVKE
jgi:bifunctional non-homologous end joining protein LigD